ncbi:MAG: DegV family protein [Lysobacteraceae bacterium]
MSAAPLIRAIGLRRALIAGMQRVIARRDLLNRINVFPVPDGDTGSNLAFTLNSVLSGSLGRRARSAGALLRAVGDDAIDGARGNSGAILAQFLHGVGEVAGEHGALTPALLAEAVDVGAQRAQQALAQPREGTILSVISAFARALADASAASDIGAWFGQALAQARQALARTPEQLAVLRQAGVVDAGAQGFVDLLEGIHDFIESGTGSAASASLVDETPAFAGEHWHEEADPHCPWCSECLLHGERLDRAALHAALAALGATSVVLAGGDARLRVHAHVADPAALFETLGRFGRVEARKAEDMRLQHRAARDASQVAIVTDSGADLPREVAERLSIHMVPVRVSFGAEDFLDKVSISPTEFYRRLRQSDIAPQTSQPPPGDFRRQFDFLLSHHRDLVYVGISRALSGTLQSAETAAARLGVEHAWVTDSGHASCGQGLLVIAAAEAAARGAQAATIRAEVERLRPTVMTWAVTRDVSAAVRGGRIPRWVLPLARGLRLSAIARVKDDGRLGVCGALFGHHDLPRRIARYLLRRVDAGKRWRVMVGHGDCAADGQALLDALTAALRCDDAWLVETGPAVGAHAGPGTLVIALQAPADDDPG